MSRAFSVTLVLLVAVLNARSQRCIQYDLENATSFSFDDINRLANGNLVFVGHMYYGTPSIQHMVVGHLDATLEPLWVVDIPGTGEGAIGSFAKVVEASDGSLVVSCDLYTDGRHTAMIMRLNSVGAVMWTRLIDHPTYNAWLYDLADVGGNEFFVVGSADGYPLTIKFDLAGTILWSRQYQISNSQGAFDGIAHSPTAGLLLAGYCNLGGAAGSGYEMVLVRMSLNGDLVWAKRSALPLYQTLQGLSIQGDSMIQVAGHMINASGSEDIYTGGFDLDGVLSWERRYSSEAEQINLSDMLSSQAGGIELVGYIKLIPLVVSGLHISLDGNGQMMFANTYGTVDASYPGVLRAAIREGASGCLMTGYFGVVGAFSSHGVIVASEGAPTKDCEDCGVPITFEEVAVAVNFIDADLVASDSYLPIDWTRTSSPIGPLFDPCLFLRTSETHGSAATVTAQIKEDDRGTAIELDGWDGPVRIQVWDLLGHCRYDQHGFNNGRMLIPISAGNGTLYLIRASSASYQVVTKAIALD